MGAPPVGWGCISAGQWSTAGARRRPESMARAGLALATVEDGNGGERAQPAHDGLLL